MQGQFYQFILLTLVTQVVPFLGTFMAAILPPEAQSQITSNNLRIVTQVQDFQASLDVFGILLICLTFNVHTPAAHIATPKTKPAWQERACAAHI